ncbi:MAG: nucleotidyltransferase family protein [Anaerolineales bacterium]|nr:nucleotidyltransferase family protein [Anaerolineales bacterium]
MITALILAAGQSKRMGRPKMLLPWGKTTVLGQVIEVFKAAGIEDILVVTGGAREQVDTLIGNSARTVFNPNFAEGEMLSSLQVGLAEVRSEVEALLVGLGDQPQVQERSVRLVVEEYATSGSPLIVPSFQMRRGHPWLVARPYWDEILRMSPPETPRDFLNRHTSEIRYVEVNDPGILKDLDTPEDYLKSRP